ncbi:MAG: hypothetical protein ACOYJ8_02690 [Patescibacteria group bacterium]|jgi:hypothetical protein
MKRFTLFLFALIFLVTPQKSLAQTEEHLWKRVTQTHPQKIADYLKIEQTQISAIVGYGKITIEGYTSPEANVQLTSSQGNLGQHNTKANKEGFFQFTNIILPEKPGELWLQATDKQGLTSSPVAIPEPPPNLGKIEDIILPPTLTHNHGLFRKGTKALGFGQTTPNSQVQIYFFQNQDVSWFKKLLLASPFTSKNAQAQQDDQSSLLEKKLTLKTDKKGYFSFQLPNQKSQTFRYYAGSIFADNYSPKSNILSFRVLSLIDTIYQQILIFADSLFSLIFFLLRELLFWIFLEIIILILLIKRRRTYSSSPSF